MNILFIEDERELRENGVAQLEFYQYTVYPVSNLAEARVIMENPAMPVHLVLADQSLPDGQGIHFVIEMKEQFPDCQYVIVSGCLTDGNTSLLEEKDIPYFRKPLLYGKVVAEVRRAHLMKAPCREPAPEVPCDEVVVPSEEEAEEAACAPEAPKRKKWFGLFG
jgi:DNA-binding NtrC family response regulator